MKSNITTMAIGLLMLFLSGCAPTPTVTKVDNLTSPGKYDIYVLPFRDLMVPEAVSERVLNQYVDLLNLAGNENGYFFIIYKDINRDGDAWIQDKYYLSGDLFGYSEESGCCSTFINLNGKIDYYQPGEKNASLSIQYPAETVINYQVENPEAVREQFILEFATTLSEQVISGLSLQK